MTTETKPKAEVKPKTETKPKAEVKPKVVIVEGATDYDDYQKFAELKFLQWKDGTYESKNLNPESLKVFNVLEKRFKDYKGKVPKIDKTLALGSDGQRCRIVKGYAAPKSLYDKYKEHGQADKYFD